MSYRIINDLGDGRIEYYGVSFGINLFSSNESEAYIYPTLKDASKTLFKLGKNFGIYFPNSTYEIIIEEI